MKLLGVVLVGIVASGARADVAGVRREVRRIDAAPMAVATSLRMDLSLEGAEIKIYRSARSPRKIVAQVLGESFRTTETIYLRGGAPLFVFRVDLAYKEPITSPNVTKTALRTQTRLYFQQGRLLERRIGTKIVAASAAQRAQIEAQTRASIRLYLSPAKDER